MKVAIDRTLTGFRLTLPNGAREFIRYHENLGNWWCRAYARQALDILENLYGATRRNVRFEH